MVFGLLGGVVFVLPMIECNKYLPGRRAYVNGLILTGTGLGSAIFGQFSYNFLNPEFLPPNQGYYDVSLVDIPLRVPSCLRWLALMYFVIVAAGTAMMAPVILQNKR